MSEWRPLASLRQLAGDAVVYLMGSALVGAAGLVLIPLYTRHLQPVAFGAYALVEALVQVAVVILALGANVAYLKWFADLPVDRRRPLLTGTLLLTGGAAAVCGSALAGIAVTQAGASIGLPPQRVFWTVAPLVVSGVVTNLLLTELRCRRRAALYSTACLVRVLATVGASLYTVAVAPGGVAGVLYGRLVGEVAGLLLLIGLTANCLGRPGEWAEIKKMVRYGLPIVVSSLTVTLLGVSGRYLLTWFGTLGDVGIYAAATKIAGIVSLLLVQPIGIAWGGLMFQIAKEPDSPRLYELILSATWAVGWAVVAALGLVAPELFSALTSPAYIAAERVFPWLLLTQLMTLMQYPSAIGLYLTHRTGVLSLVYVAGLVVNVLIGIPLVLRSGSVGAAVAWFAANAVITGVTWTLGQRWYRVPWRPAWFAVVGGLGGALLAVGTAWPERPWSGGLVVRAALGLAACALAVFVGLRPVVNGGRRQRTFGG